jgi:hypothetical protein
MDNFDEIKSPLLRKVIERRGINDDQVTDKEIEEEIREFQANARPKAV